MSSGRLSPFQITSNLPQWSRSASTTYPETGMSLSEWIGQVSSIYDLVDLGPLDKPKGFEGTVAVYQPTSALKSDSPIAFVAVVLKW